MTQRLPIGDHVDRLLAEAQPHELLEPLLGPHAVAAQPEARFLLGHEAGPGERSRETRDFLCERAEQADVGLGRRLRGLTGAELLGPLRHPREGARDRPADERPRDGGEQQHQQADSNGGLPPEAQLPGLELLGVEHHRDRADRAIVALERRDVDPHRPAAESGDAPGWRVVTDGLADQR